MLSVLWWSPAGLRTKEASHAHVIRSNLVVPCTGRWRAGQPRVGDHGVPVSTCMKASLLLASGGGR
eukprot:scaffold3662_cov388-Prasinococcus_capsulatus_cf.AAC.4